HGVGDIKVRRYADDFLPIIRDYCAANGLSEQLKRRSRPDSTRSFNSQGRPGQALDLLNGGHTILEIAHQLSVRPRTVIEYVWRAAQAGESIRTESVLSSSNLSPAEQQEALQAFAELGTER